jgi:hypothetical protein
MYLENIYVTSCPCKVIAIPFPTYLNTVIFFGRGKKEAVPKVEQPSSRVT